ncbi:hypothetical protein Acr_00g0018730 [Actinidia rufa]|uniref:Uncharacterized protein n=1 Tax=Actinidia rufa TaxID=165716 RepID=A0A7J0DDD6_9ERIC|nr:hypothetical protein Acr_00g0018730 [Actinidia rufa]
MWWVVVPRANRKNLRTKSRKDMEEILKTKLAMIKEEPETCDDNRALSNHLWVAKKGKQIGSKTKTGRVFVMPQFSLRLLQLLPKVARLVFLNLSLIDFVYSYIELKANCA